MSKFNIAFPVGWEGIGFYKPTKDPYLHHIETWDNPEQDWISMCICLNRKFSEIPVDDKFPFQNAHYYLRMTEDETFQLKEALEQHLKNRNYKKI